MPLRFRKCLIADERYETAGIFDVDGDGVADIVSGAWWYQGPAFKRRHYIGEVAAFDEWFDDFSTIALDVNGDGRLDFVTGGYWGDTLRWRENPGDPEKEWPEHIIAHTGPVETTRAWDVDADGILEIVPNTPRDSLSIYKLQTDERGAGTGSFQRFPVREERQRHGLGCGDIAGNGRMDIVLNNGWLEAPARPFAEPWIWHSDFELFHRSSVPILVVDVNGDSVNDLIVGAAHDYGLDWWEQQRSAGSRRWLRHPIDPFNAQYHDLMWIDIDGDGTRELVTGKRYRAHNGNDPGGGDDIGTYYFKWTGESFAKQVIDFGPPRVGTGIGNHMAMADLTGNGLPDLVAPGKDGLYIFFNEGM